MSVINFFLTDFIFHLCHLNFQLFVPFGQCLNWLIHILLFSDHFLIFGLHFLYFFIFLNQPLEQPQRLISKHHQLLLQIINLLLVVRITGLGLSFFLEFFQVLFYQGQMILVSDYDFGLALLYFFVDFRLEIIDVVVEFVVVLLDLVYIRLDVSGCDENIVFLWFGYRTEEIFHWGFDDSQTCNSDFIWPIEVEVHIDC